MPRVSVHQPLLLVALTLFSQAQGQTPASVYSLQTLAGGDYAGDGGLATAAFLVQLQGVATDTRGNVYIADADDNRVRKIAPSGIISTFAGNGHAGFSGDGGPASAAQLRTPYGLAADRTGNIYIADLGNARIRRVSPDGIISTFAGGGSTGPVQANGGAATAIALNSPRNIAVDFYGTVYFSDFGGNRVYQVSSTGTLTILAGSGQAGFSGDGSIAWNAQLSAPAGVAVDPAGAVYIADSGNARVRKVYRGVISTLGDSGIPGATLAFTVVTPVGLAVDPDGSLFIADAGGNQILRVTPALAVTPMAQPARDIAIDTQGNLYACSGAVLYRRPRLGGVTVVAGQTSGTYLGDNGPLLNARLVQPGAIAHDRSGNLYVADTGHHRIRKITPDGNIYTIAGNGQAAFGGDGGPAVGAQLNGPVGVAVDAAGTLYIADTGNHRIRAVDLSGNITTIAGTGTPGRSPDATFAAGAQLDTPTWLAAGADGAVYVSETGSHLVRKVVPGGLMSTVAGNGVRGYTGDGGSATASSLDTPQGLAIDSTGDLYIADAGNHRIRYVAAPSAFGPSIISTIPDSGATAWRSLSGLALDASGSIYVADAGDQRVFRIDPPGRVLTIAGTGVQAFNGESGAALSMTLDTPAGIVAGLSGSVYFADSGNGRIRALMPVNDSIQNPAPAQSVLTVVNAASLQAAAIAPGEIVSIFGPSLGPAAGVSAAKPSNELGGVQVLVNGHAAPIFYAGPSQINIQVPYSLDAVQACDVQVVSGGIVKGQAAVTLADTVPALFTVANGTGQAAALNQDGSYNSPDNPAERGSVIVLYATGEGKTTPDSIEGQPAGVPTPVPAHAVSVQIGGYSAQIAYAGEAPGYSGLLQVNAVIPGGFAPPGILPVLLRVGAASSQAGVTIAVK